MSKVFAPIPIAVTVGPNGQPRGFVWKGRRRWVRRVCNHWRVERDWWSQPIARDYYKLLTGDGLICVVFQDRQKLDWYFERLFD